MLRLEKWIDTDLRYLRDADPVYCTIDPNMPAEAPLPVTEELPVFKVSFTCFSVLSDFIKQGMRNLDLALCVAINFQKRHHYSLVEKHDLNFELTYDYSYVLKARFPLKIIHTARRKFSNISECVLPKKITNIGLFI